MASNFSLCGLCKTLDLSSLSTVWCLQCDRGLCDDCKKRHKACCGTESHQMTPIDKYRHLPADVLKISQTCPEHDERYQAYCNVHECACCFKCTLKEHKKCENLLPIDDIVKGVKLSNAFRECETNIEENKENIGVIIKDRQRNISCLSEEKAWIQNEIKQTRKKVNEHLDKLEAQLLEELTELEKVHTTKIQTLILSLDKKQQEIEEMRGNLKALKEHASEIQIFLSMKNMEKRSFTDNEYIEKLCSSETLNILSLSAELDKTLRNIEKRVTTFGRLYQNSSPPNIVLRRRKHKQAQLHLVTSTRSIDSIKLNLIREVDVKKKYLNGCCFLPDGRYAVTSNGYDPVIFVMSEDGTVDCEISTKPYKVGDITHIPSTNTIVATSGDDMINIIDLENKKITRSFPSGTKNFGNVYKDGYIIYSAIGVGLCKMNMINGKVTTITLIPNMSTVTYVASYQDKLYYTNREAHTVTCCSMDGRTLWEFKDRTVLRGPQGICLDAQGFLYVVGDNFNNFFVISSDGSSISELSTSTDGLDCPIAVDYDRTTDRLLVANLTKKVFMYSVC